LNDTCPLSPGKDNSSLLLIFARYSRTQRFTTKLNPNRVHSVPPCPCARRNAVPGRGQRRRRLDRHWGAARQEGWRVSSKAQREQRPGRKGAGVEGRRAGRAIDDVSKRRLVPPSCLPPRLQVLKRRSLLAFPPRVVQRGLTLPRLLRPPPAHYPTRPRAAASQMMNRAVRGAQRPGPRPRGPGTELKAAGQRGAARRQLRGSRQLQTLAFFL